MYVTEAGSKKKKKKMRKPNLEKERKGNKQRETTVGRNGEEFGKNG